ncbi:MAG TPA: hypothetical protein VE131_11065, partial [Terriglobales bacterium]|nr:hypothetical protein [Terriglobales bacterium]
LCFPGIWLLMGLTGICYGGFTGKGHVHTISETQHIFLNPHCQSTDSCDLKRFALTKVAYEVWFSDDPDHPTYASGAIIEYETDAVAALQKYTIVQFNKGCVFYSSRNHSGKIERKVSDTVSSFGQDVPFCFPNWVIDSQDKDPAYNSDPEYGRFHLLRWNKIGSYNARTQKFYGSEKPQRPVVYVTDYPAGAFVTDIGVKNVALEFNTCIYKANEVPMDTRRDNIHFAKPIHCFEWQSVYIYDFDQGRFLTHRVEAPWWEEPAPRISLYVVAIFVVTLFALALLWVRKLR